MASDRIVLPPSRRETTSPQGRFRLIVETRDNWQTPRPQAELQRGMDASWGRMWSKTLPHHHGPREALVSDQGEVLLVDEFINVTSRWTLVLIDLRGQEQQILDYAAVVRALGVSPQVVSDAARMGTWLSGKPTFDALQEHALIPTAGRVLRVRMADGQLSVAAK